MTTPNLALRPTPPAGATYTRVYLVTCPALALRVRRCAERVARWTERFNVYTRQEKL